MGVIYPSIVDSFDTKDSFRGSSISTITTRKRFGKPLDKDTFDENYRRVCKQIDEIVLALKEAGFTKIAPLESEEDVIHKGDNDLLFPIVINRSPIIESLKKYAQVKDHKIVFDKDAFIKDFINIDSIAEKVKVDYNDIVQKIDYKTLTSKLNKDELLKKIKLPDVPIKRFVDTRYANLIVYKNTFSMPFARWVPKDNNELKECKTGHFLLSSLYYGNLTVKLDDSNFVVIKINNLNVDYLFECANDNYSILPTDSLDIKDKIDVYFFGDKLKDIKINSIKLEANYDEYIDFSITCEFADTDSEDKFKQLFGEDGEFITTRNLTTVSTSTNLHDGSNIDNYFIG